MVQKGSWKEARLACADYNDQTFNELDCLVFGLLPLAQNKFSQPIFLQYEPPTILIAYYNLL